MQPSVQLAAGSATERCPPWAWAFEIDSEQQA
eukprot:CAMPEP_0183538344 /NCGR_PEP_ID=MMETSP0371-20130417/29521_1 /TAXON_ID=268820 /ORGANISM="Peridinium aciculiferum, Strain PAER-2" /LENGTH=31 /DNA_ID= /DNA_START= /DNA_END= /DNA_ORIENTATION=